VRVHIDAARQHELAGGIDDRATTEVEAAHGEIVDQGNDLAVVDEHVCTKCVSSGHHGAASDSNLHRITPRVRGLCQSLSVNSAATNL